MEHRKLWEPEEAPAPAWKGFLEMIFKPRMNRSQLERESFWQKEQQGQRPRGKKKKKVRGLIEEVKAVWYAWNRGERLLQVMLRAQTSC